MNLLAQFVICSASIFTPLRLHTPQHGFLYQLNGRPCIGVEIAKAIDETYTEFKDRMRPVCEAEADQFKRSLCLSSLNRMPWSTDIFFWRYQIWVPSYCLSSLRYAIVQADDKFSVNSTIVINSLLPADELRGVLAQAWPQAMQGRVVGYPEGCVE